LVVAARTGTLEQVREHWGRYAGHVFTTAAGTPGKPEATPQGEPGMLQT